MTLLWDRYHLGERTFLQARPITLRLGRRTLHTNTVNVSVAVAFAIMGGLVLYLADTGTMTTGRGFQVVLGDGVATALRHIEIWTAPVPEVLLGLALLAVAAVFVTATLRDRRRPSPEEVADEGAQATTSSIPSPNADRSPRCHDHTTSSKG